MVNPQPCKSSPSRIDTIRAYYEPKLASRLPDYETLGWESRQAQELRFAALTDNFNLTGRSLLDVGCGLGNLLEFLNERGIPVRYTGVDILPSMIARAEKKNLNGKFLNLDLFTENPFGEKSIDVIYASGMFNLDLGNNVDFLKRSLCRFFAIAREAVAFNLLDHRSPTREDRYAYFSPVEVLGMIENLECKPHKTQIIERYLSNDFTVICQH